MAGIGGEIKVVLTLDDNGFTLKTKKAKDTSDALDAGLKNLASSAKGVEAPLESVAKTMEGIASQLSDFTASFKAADASMTPVQKSVSAVAQAVSSLATGLQKAADTTSAVTKGVADIGAAAAPAEKSVSGVATAANALAQNFDKSVPALLRARTGLQEAGTAAARSAAELNAANSSVASSSQKAVGALLSAPSAALKAAMAQSQLAGATINTTKAKAASSAATTKATQSNTALTKAITSLESVIGKLAGTVIQLTRSNNALATSTDKNTVATDALSRATTASASATQVHNAALQQAGNNMNTTRGQADALTSSLKGMAAMWGALKIEKGLGASVNDASEMQKQRTIVDSLNLGQGQTQEFFDKAFDLAKTTKFLSQLDAVKSRMSAIASVGENNVATIDATLETAVKAANNLQSLGLAHGDMQSTIRNLYGVVETRQQVQDPAAAKKTFELLQQVSTATGGKVQIQDAETVLRQMGAGAARLNDDGLINLMAVVDQFKVAGGDGGGGGAGVSRVGTAYKMFQQYALGKQMTDSAVNVFAGSGLLNMDSIDFSSNKKQIRSDAKHAGLVDGDLAAADPVQWLQKHYDQLLSFTQQKQNQGKYFQGKDINDATAQAVAIQKVLVALGITTTAAQAMSTAMDPASAERINVQRNTIKNSAGVEDVNAKIQNNYDGQVTQFKANLKDLGTMIGTSVLPVLTSLLTVINEVFTAFKNVGKDNPMLVQLTTIATAALGVVLAFKGFASITGIAGNVLKTLGGFAEAGAAVGAFGAATTATATVTTTALTGILGSISLFVSTAGKLFLRAVPYVGWLLVAWDLTTLVGGLDVGGHKVSDWFTHWFDSLMLKAQTFWKNLKSTFDDIKSWKLFSDDPKADSNAPTKSNFVPRYSTAAHGYDHGGPNQRGDADAARVQRADNDRTAREAAFNAREVDPTIDQREANRFTSLTPKATHAAPSRGGLELDETDANKLAGVMGGHKDRQFEDPFVKFLEQLKSKNEVANTDLAALLGRQPKGLDALRADATSEFTAKWQGGDFDKAHDPRNRQWKNADGSLDTSNAQVKDAIDQMAQLKQEEEQKKAIVFVNERLASTENDLNEAITNASENGAAKQTREMTALERELARAEERLGTGTKAWQEWNLRKNEALANRAGADLINFSSSFKVTDDKTLMSLLPTDRERKAAEFDAGQSKDLDQYNKDKSTLQTDSDAAISAAQNDTSLTAEGRAQKVKDIQSKTLSEQLQAEQAFNQHLSVVAAERKRLLETPMDGLARTWQDTLKQMEDAEASWASGVINAMMQFVETGKLNISKLAESMALDVLKIKLQETFSTPLKMGLDALTGQINKFVFSGSAAAPSNSAIGAANAAGANSLGGAATAADALKTGLTTLTQQGVQTTTNALSQQVTQLITSGNVQGAATTSLSALANAAMIAAQALAQVGGSSAGGSFGGLFGSLGSAFGLNSGASAASAASAGVGANTYGFTMPAFANGGIMTSKGVAQLRKYATGGVANSPQLAMYGEGSTPEAYVPLPDGKTIPVTLSGNGSTTSSNNGSGATPAVTVNVINQSGTQMSAQQGSPRFDGQQLILDVVLTAAQQPGQFRDGMKQSLR